MERDINIKKAEKVVESSTDVAGLEIKFEDEQGNERGVAFDDYDEACQECPDCGKPKYKCSLEKDKEVKHPSEREHGSESRASNGSARERTDVKADLEL